MSELCENCSNKLGEHDFDSIAECVRILDARKAVVGDVKLPEGDVESWPGEMRWALELPRGGGEVILVWTALGLELCEVEGGPKVYKG